MPSATTERVPFVVDSEDRAKVVVDPDEDGEHDDEECGVGDDNRETLLMDRALKEEVSRIGEVVLAPGRGRRPLSFIRDKHAEELSFPTIYHGKARSLVFDESRKRKVSYSQIAKHELMFYKRVCCRHDKLFFSFRLKQTYELFSGISLCVRQRKRGSKAVTASDLLDNERVADLIKIDGAFSFMRNVRSSPAFWEHEKKKLFAMIRQFGNPTLFLTLTSADGRWPELLVVLEQVVNGKV